MPNSAREWDEDPWDHSDESPSWQPKSLPKGKGVYNRTGYQLQTLSPALTRSLEDSIRKEVEKVVNDAFQRIMDRLDELQELIERD